MAPPEFKVSNNRDQNADYLKEHRNRIRTGFHSIVGEPLQVRASLRIRICLDRFIPKSMGFSQS
jgi:hypothetical protein